MTQKQLAQLWSEYVLTKQQPTGFKCLLVSGEQIIQSVWSGERWRTESDAARWSSVAPPGQAQR